MSFRSDVPASDEAECAAFLKNGYLSCFDSKKISPAADKVAISTPINHYYKNKEYNRYSKQTIAQIVADAISNGNDPYMALAITIMENPPKGDRRSEGYANSYGNPPIDTIAFADFLSCQAQVEIYKAPVIEHGVVSRTEDIWQTKFIQQRKTPHFDVEKNDVLKKLCLRQLSHGSAPFLVFWGEGTDKECCFTATVSPKDQAEDILHKLLPKAVHGYLAKRLQFAVKNRIGGTSDPAMKLAIIGQAYNGYGKAGITESTFNKCIDKMNFGTTPLYGAGVSELMLNSLMANSEIHQMVTDSQKKIGRATPSYLCVAYGDGRHKIDGLSFSRLMKRFTSDRQSCPDLSYEIKGYAPVSASRSRTSSSTYDHSVK